VKAAAVAVELVELANLVFGDAAYPRGREATGRLWGLGLVEQFHAGQQARRNVSRDFCRSFEGGGRFGAFG
jgi:hypothetical protein